MIAAGPSNEGNDKTSTSPVRFLDALGDAYRASGRTAPFMDALGFHVYPRATRIRRRSATPGRTPARPTSHESSRPSGTRSPARAADVPAERPPASRGIPRPRGRTSSAGRWPSARACRRATRQGERADDQRGRAGAVLRGADPDARVRSGRDRRDDLPPRRRGRPRPVPDRAAADRQVSEAPVVRRRRQGDQDGPELAGPRATWKPRDAASSARRRSSRRADHPARPPLFGISVTAAEDARGQGRHLPRPSGPDAKPEPGEVARSLAVRRGDLDARADSRRRSSRRATRRASSSAARWRPGTTSTASISRQTMKPGSLADLRQQDLPVG